MKRKESEVQVVRETKVQKTVRGEVGGAGTLKYRKKVSSDLYFYCMPLLHVLVYDSLIIYR